MMNGWIDVTKNTEARERGLEQELDACLITVVFLWVSLCVRKGVFTLLSTCTGEKEGLLRNPCRHEDSPVLFCQLFPLFS